MNLKELKLAGGLLYLCEGTKLRQDLRYKNTFIYSIEFTNSNPKIVALFVKFMKKVLKIEPGRIKGQLFIYPDLDKEKVMKIWSGRTGIPVEQFQKIIMLKAKGSKFKHNPLGTFKVRHSGKEKFLMLQDIIDDVWRDARVV
jgi:hypothetical protein